MKQSGSWRRAALALVACATLAVPTAVLAQAQGIDPRATALLKSATDFLARQPKFTVDTRSTLEVVLTSGQKIQFGHTARQSVQRPDRLRAERIGDLVDQVIVYDGKTLTLNDRGRQRFASVPAPGTIDAMLEFARVSLDLAAPAGDLIAQDAYAILMTDVSSGFVVGKGMVEGVRCDHLAFRAPQVDWQIWIEEGPRPLIRQLVLTTRDIASAPQFTVVATRWDLAPRFTDTTFRFTPPKGARQVDFLPVAGR